MVILLLSLMYLRLITLAPGLVCIMLIFLSLGWGIETCLQVRHSRPWSCLLHKNVSVWHFRLLAYNCECGVILAGYIVPVLPRENEDEFVSEKPNVLYCKGVSKQLTSSSLVSWL